MAKKTTKKNRALSVYSNLANKRRTKKDKASRRHAEYLASLPKHPIKRLFYRLHPKRVAAFWFSKRGGLLALKLLGVIMLVGMLTVGAVFAYYRKDLDNFRPGKLAERVQTTVTKYYDRNDVLLWEDKGEGNYRLAVKDDEISTYMKQATVAIEDKHFYEHDGVSFSGIARSAFNNAGGGSVQGGSTLTQQLVKQVFLADDAHKRGIDGVPRKIKEIILAIEVERMYNKQQILNLYLNESPYGGRRNGVESAAQTYFGKPAKQLNLAESALLAAIPNQPGLYDPYNVAGNEYLIARQHKTLDSMVEMGYIKQAEADEAKKVPIMDTVKPLSDQLENIKAPHFVLMVRNELEKELGKAIVGRGGLTVKTTLDSRIQDKLEESTNKLFAGPAPNYAGFSNSSSVVEDVQTGQIVALTGSRDFKYPGFGQDNATTAFIQPGSTIKPFVYAKLFSDQGANKPNFGSGSILADDNSMTQIYGAPLKNWDGRYMGAINVRKSLALSRNVPAVKAMHIDGVQPTWDLIRAMGNTKYCTQGPDAQAGLSSAIGGCGTRQVDHTNAFATLARQGVYRPEVSILEVRNSQNDVLKKYADSSKNVLDPQVAYILSDMMADPAARSALHGRYVYGIDIPGVKTATKTGTSDKDGKPKDLWVASYSPVLAMTTWVGNPDTRVLNNANSSIPAPIIGDVMSFAHNEIYAKDGRWKPGDWFTQPAGVQNIAGELYPSWYNKSQAQSREKMVFDKVSKKKATDCTPEGARIEVDVTGYTDPVTKRKVFLANDGYDPQKDDDVHSCGDAKPNVSLSPSSNGKQIVVNYANGRYPLKTVVVSVNGTEIANLSVSSSGSTTVPNTVGVDKSYTVTATITDDVYYTGTGSATWTKPSSPSGSSPTD